MRAVLRLAPCVLVALLLLPSVGHAAGFTYPENLTRAMGRGGAWIAGVDDASALYLNPGALTRIDRGSLVLNLNVIDYDLRFQRATLDRDRSPTGEPRAFAEVRNESRPYLAPMLFGGMRVGDLPLVLATGVYGPSSVGRLRFPDPPAPADEFDGQPRDGSQRYMIIDQDVLLFYPSLAAAWRFDAINLSVGAVAQLAVALIDYNIAIDGSHSIVDGQRTGEMFVINRELEEYSLLSRTRLDVSGAVPTANLGLLWEPHERLAFGLSWHPRFQLRASGTIDVEFPEGIRAFADSGDLAVLEDKVRLEINFPHVLRFGTLYRHLGREGGEIFNVEAAAVYEGWSVLEEYAVRTDVSIQIPNLSPEEAGDNVRIRSLEDIFLPKQYRDSVSLRLGGEVHALRYDPTTPRLSLRAGTFFETAATRPEFAHLDFLSPQRIGTALGATWHVRHDSGAISAIDIGMSMVFSPDVVVDNGQYDLLVPLWVCVDPRTAREEAECVEARQRGIPGVGHPVNEGTFSSHMNVLSVGFSHRW